MYILLSLIIQSQELFVVFVLRAMLNRDAVVCIVEIDCQIEFEFFRNWELMSYSAIQQESKSRLVVRNVVDYDSNDIAAIES